MTKEGKVELTMTSPYSQKIVSRDIELASVWSTTKPKGKSRIVVFLHGGPDGNKDAPHNLFTILQEKLASLGIDSVRFDFMGEGESSGDYLNTTLTTQKEDFEAVYNEIRSKGYQSIGVIAESFGGTCLLGALKEEFQVLVLLWPAIYLFDEGKCFAPYYEEPYLSQLKQKGYIEFEKNRAGPDFFREIKEINNLEVPFRKITVPTLIIHGTHDSEVPLSKASIDLYRNLSKESKVVLCPGLDHFLGVPGSDGSKVKHEIVYEEVPRWIMNHLK